MGDELRHEQRTEAPNDSEDPTQTGARSRGRSQASARSARDDGGPQSGERLSQLEQSAINELRSGAQTGWQVPASGRVSRTSIRPSAFGLPRASQPELAASDSEHRPRTEARASTLAPVANRESTPPQASGRSSSHSIPPRLSQTVRKRAAGRAQQPAVKTDIEELLPISHGVKSLPRPPRLPTFETTPQLPLAAARRFPWASLAVFVVMLGASFAPLSQYRGERQVSAAKAAEQRELRAEADANEPPAHEREAQPAGAMFRSRAEGPGASTPTDPFAYASLSGSAQTLSAGDQIERAFWGEPSQAREALLQEAERALSSDDERLAESLFGRALEFDGDFDGDDARAEFGLARVRLSQTDLDGAEGWALVTIRKRPRRAEYRALHAEILQRRGRGSEAQMERALARSLAHFSRGTRTR